MPRAGYKQAKKPPGTVLQRDPPAAAKRGKIPDPAPAGLGRAAFAGGAPLSRNTSRMARGSLQEGSGAKAAACAGPAAAASARAAKNKKSPAGGQIPGQELRGFWGPNGAGKGPLLCGITGGRRGIPAKKAADAALRGIASAAFCMVVLFWVAFGKVRVCAVLPARPENEAP